MNFLTNPHIKQLCNTTSELVLLQHCYMDIIIRYNNHDRAVKRFEKSGSVSVYDCYSLI